MAFDQSLINDVLHHADIVDIISRYIDVIQKGREYVALCPFHDDRNPSMQISKTKQIFKCFVCGSGGNAIKFVEMYEHLNFFDAMRKVAQLSGYSDARLEIKSNVKAIIVAVFSIPPSGATPNSIAEAQAARIKTKPTGKSTLRA